MGGNKIDDSSDVLVAEVLVEGIAVLGGKKSAVDVTRGRVVPHRPLHYRLGHPLPPV